MVASRISDLITKLLAHHGKETAQSIKTRVSRQWRPGISALRPFPAMRTGRLRESVGYVVSRNRDTTTLATGLMVKVPLRKGQLPPTIWGTFLEYGKTITIKDPQRPFFYVPTRNSPAQMADGSIDPSWLPGKRLREKLKQVGRNVGARAFYFPYPESKSASKRTIYIAAIRWRDGKANYVIKPTAIAIGLRKFTIPMRPFLRPAWREAYNDKGTGRLNRDMVKTVDQISKVIMGGIRGRSLEDYENSVTQTVIDIKL